MKNIRTLVLQMLHSGNMRNSFWIISEQFFQMLASLALGIITARYLGPDKNGILNYTASFVAFVMPFATLSMESIVVKKLIDHPDREGEYLGSCMVFRMASSLLSMALIAIVVYILNPSEQIKSILVLLQSLQLLFRSVFLLEAWFQRHLKSKFVSIGKIIICIMVSAYRIYILATGKSILWFALIGSLSELGIIVMLYLFYRKQNGQKLKMRKELAIETLKESYHFIFAGIMISIYSQMDRIMIGSMLTDADVGLYSVALTVCNAWVFIPSAIVKSFTPMVMEIKKSNNEQLYLQRIKQLYCAVIWLCVFASLIISVFSSAIINFMYGEAYMGSVPSLRIAIWYEMFAFVGAVRTIWIICENKSKYVKYYLCIGCMINLVLNCLMIPSIGIEGAAIATLITQFVVNLIAPLLFRETRQITKITLQGIFFEWLVHREKGENAE